MVGVNSRDAGGGCQAYQQSQEGESMEKHTTQMSVSHVFILSRERVSARKLAN
jgi:hypothetical protein